MPSNNVPDMSEKEVFEAFQEFLALKRRQAADKWVPNRNHPTHRGLVDQGYIPPPPTEFPKMLYHASLPWKIVQNREQQEQLGPAWFTSPVIKKSDWKAKGSEVYTKSGFRVYTHHVSFLIQNSIPVESLREAAEFLDKLDELEQETFFREAEEATIPEAEAKEEPAKKGSKKAA
jgi:hypothetical protein